MMRELIVLLAAGLLAAPASARPAGRPRQAVPPQRPIVNAPAVAADKARGRVTDNELVLGVALAGEARAYPINMLTGPSREIINDTLGGRAIAATW